MSRLATELAQRALAGRLKLDARVRVELGEKWEKQLAEMFKGSDLGCRFVKGSFQAWLPKDRGDDYQKLLLELSPPDVRDLINSGAVDLSVAKVASRPSATVTSEEYFLITWSMSDTFVDGIDKAYAARKAA